MTLQLKLPRASLEMTDDLDRAVIALSEAVVTPETWADALHKFARATGSVGCFLYPYKQPGQLLDLPTSPDIREYIDIYVKDAWYSRDVAAFRGWPLLKKGRALITDDDITERDERKKIAILQDYRYKWSFLNWAAIGLTVNDDLWALPLYRTERQGPVGPEQAAQISKVIPQLRNILHLATLFGTQRAKTYLDLLQAMNHAAVLVDQRGEVIAQTLGMSNLLGPDLTIRRGRLSASDVESNKELTSLLQRAVTRPDVLPTTQFPSYAIIRRPQRRPLLVRAIPLIGILQDAFGRARAILLCSDPETHLPVNRDLLVRLYKLSNAEIRLVAELGKGHTVEEIAEHLKISRETARGYLKSVYAKTGVNRQSQLLALLANLQL